MTYYCNNCKQEIIPIKKKEWFDHAFGVDYVKSMYCPLCESEEIEEEEE